MADRGFASMQIGGTLSSEDANQLRERLLAEGVFDERTNEPLDAASVDALVELAAGETLSFFDIDARGGVFDDIESFCVEHQIAFTRYSGCLYEYSPEIVHFRPGTPVVSLPANSDQDELVPLVDVHAVIDLLKAGDCTAALEKLTTTAPQVPPLEPLVLITAAPESR